MVVDASRVPEPPAAKSLAERVAYAYPPRNKAAPLTKPSTNPKAQPKSAAATKATAKDAKGRQAARPKRGKSNKPKPKTAEELDAEMTDYWGNNNAGAANSTDAAGAANGAAPAAAGEDLGMDEISVSSMEFIV